ncbi:thioredoxin [Halorubrum sp. DTA98]|uniref:thioredoxin n=1 Tax=Halorubrum sp. DTA98 TaxID=3402163 RepID=UPI003AB03580
MSSQEASVPTDPIHLNAETELEEIVSSYDVVLVDFYADWCGPCQMMEPTIEALAAESDAAVVKVDVDEFQGLAAQYGVQGIPTLILFSDGELAERLVGAQSEEALSTAIAAHAE